MALVYEEAARRLQAVDSSYQRTPDGCRRRLHELVAALDDERGVLLAPFPDLVRELAAALPASALAAPPEPVAAVAEELAPEVVHLPKKSEGDSSTRGRGEVGAASADQWDKSEVYLVAVIRASLGLSTVENKLPMWEQITAALNEITGKSRPRSPADVRTKWKTIKADYRKYVDTPEDERREKCPYASLLKALAEVKTFFTTGKMDLDSMRRLMKSDLHKNLNLNLPNEHEKKKVVEDDDGVS